MIFSINIYERERNISMIHLVSTTSVV